MTVLDLETVKTQPFIRVECGARSAHVDPTLLKAFPLARMVGFEVDAAECSRLNQTLGERFRLFPVAVAGSRDSRSLHVTANPSCSSLFTPNAALWTSFREGPSFQVNRVVEVETVDLDSYLPEAGVDRIDFLQLDVQGAELETLHGASSFLDRTVLGINCEVEFSPMYQGQPLFADVDAYLRKFDFILFDLSRARYFRHGLEPGTATRGQLLWGDALYLRDYRLLLDRNQALECLKLAVLASVYGFHDYALEIVNAVLHTPDVLDAPSRTTLEAARNAYVGSLGTQDLPVPSGPKWRAVAALVSNPVGRWLSIRVLRVLRRLETPLGLGPGAGATHWSD